MKKLINCGTLFLLFLAQTKSQPALDRDHDGIPDAVEAQLLQKFRPYFKFTLRNGQQDEYRPADVNWYLKRSEILTSGDESNSPVINNQLLAANPAVVLSSFGGAANILHVQSVSTYHINPLAKVNGISGDNPGRHGNAWNEELAQKNIGLYGHVVPVKIAEGREFDYNHVPAGGDAGKVYYKIEYWQCYGYNGAHMSLDIGDHEGDWTTVQIIVDPQTNVIKEVAHFAHGKKFSFHFASIKGSFQKSIDQGRMMEYHGNNYSTNIDLVSHDLKFNVNQGDYDRAQNNILRMYQDPSSGQYTHPIVYIENGTHEFFPSESWDYYAAPAHTGNGHSFLTNSPPNLGEAEFPLSNAVIVQYNGYWGAYSRKNDPPVGPIMHLEWTWPATSSIRWKMKTDQLPF